MKTLDNTTASQAKDNVKDIVFWGNGDTFKLISKASSKVEGWMKSTKAMEIEGVGCVVQVTTQQRNDTNMMLHKKDNEGNVIKINDIPQYDGENLVSHYTIAEAVTFVPGVKIEETIEEISQKVTSRKLVKI